MNKEGSVDWVPTFGSNMLGWAPTFGGNMLGWVPTWVLIAVVFLLLSVIVVLTLAVKDLIEDNDENLPPL
jgi:hypothetical protein